MLFEIPTAGGASRLFRRDKRLLFKLTFLGMTCGLQAEAFAAEEKLKKEEVQI